MKHLDFLIERYPILADCEKDIRNAIEAVTACYENGGKLLLCGNGGSCADCDHIVGELMKGFLKKRPLAEEVKSRIKDRCPQIENETLEKLQTGLGAISIPSLSALYTAFSNDVDADLAFAQATLALGSQGDVFIGLSTSGNAKNVLEAARVARGKGMTVIALTGKSGGALAKEADVAIRVNERETFKVQELHLPVYHCICAEVEEHFFEL